MKDYDLVIIGGGAAGLAAGVYGGRARLKTALLEKGAPGGMAYSTRELVNYPGFYQDGVSGPALSEAFAAHAKKFGTEILRETVQKITVRDDGRKIVSCKKGSEYCAKALILALGNEPRTLGIPGEKEFRGNGVSYCATCDAETYADCTVAVVGDGDAGIEEAMYIAKFAQKVYILALGDKGVLGCNKASAEKALAHPKLEFLWNASLKEIRGDEDVRSIRVENLKTGAIGEYAVDGVFFYIGMIPNTKIISDLVATDKKGYILTDEKMATSVPGIFAVGDCREKYLRQVVTAAADGAVAATAAGKYIEEAEELDAILASEKPVILAFWNPMDSSCLDILAHAEQQISAGGKDVRLIKVDMYRKQMLVQRYAVQHPSTFILLSAGDVQKKIPSASREQVSAFISSL